MKSKIWAVVGTITIATVLLASCISKSGIQPIYPAGTRRITVDTVATLTPTLSWQPYVESGAEDVRYDVVVFKAVPTPKCLVSPKCLVGEVAYSKSGIEATSHTIEIPLDPNIYHFWQVRATYRRNGQAATGDWNGFYYGAVTPYYSTVEYWPYQFKTPALSGPGPGPTATAGDTAAQPK